MLIRALRVALALRGADLTAGTRVPSKGPRNTSSESIVARLAGEIIARGGASVPPAVRLHENGPDRLELSGPGGGRTSIRFEPSGVTGNDYYPFMRQWKRLIRNDGSIESIIMRLPNGIRFRFEEIPGGKGARGTLIEIGPQPLDEILPMLRAYCDVCIPKWRSKLVDLDRPPETLSNRVVIPENMTERLHRWGFNRHVYFRTICRPAATLLSTISGTLEKRGRLTRAQRTDLLKLEEQMDQEIAPFKIAYDLWAWVMENAVEGPKSSSPSAQFHSLRHVLHDLQRVNSILFAIKNGVIQLRENQPLTAEWRETFQTSEGAAVSNAVKGGIAFAKGSFHGEMGDVLMAFGNRRVREEGDFHVLERMILPEDQESFYRLQEVLTNLISNAVRYRDPKKRPEFQTPTLMFQIRPGYSLDITVIDHGVGIAPDHLKNLGREGYREHRVEVAGSQGIGFASVIENLKILGYGPPWVRSEVGVGTAVRITIPGEKVRWVGRQPPVTSDGLTITQRNEREGFVVPDAAKPLLAAIS